MFLPDPERPFSSTYHPYAELKKFADFAANLKTEDEISNAGEIVEAPKTLLGHTVAFYLKPTDRQRYKEFLEGLEKTFGKEIVDRTIPLKERDIKQEHKSLGSRITAHLANNLIETVRPVLNRYLKDIRIDLSIPDPKEELPPTTGWISRVTRTHLTPVVKEAKGLLNQNLKNARLDLSIPEPAPLTNYPLSRQKIRDAIKKNHNLFISYVSSLCDASAAAQAIHEAIQTLKSETHQQAISIDPYFEGEKKLLTERVLASQEKKSSVLDYAHNVARQLYLEDDYASQDKFTQPFDRISQDVVLKLQALSTSFLHSEDLATKLIALKKSALGHFSSKSEEQLLHQKRELSNHLKMVVDRSIQLISTATEIVDQISTWLPPCRNEETSTSLDQVESLTSRFEAEFDQFEQSLEDIIKLL
jgi:predicted DNA-binding protein YlxM (UPF0122 family)